MTTQYIDGLGRPVQTVVKGGSLITDSVNLATSANAKDLVSSIEYDQYGREVYQYLPFVSDTVGAAVTNNGLFKINPFQQQVRFYNSHLAGQTGETSVDTNNLNWAYSQNVFEESPLNRINKSMAPGVSWVGSSRGVNVKYWANTASDSVTIWTVTDGTNAGDWGTYATAGTYTAGQLQKTVTEDEHGKQVIEFKDKEGQVVLKKVQLTASADTLDGAGRGHWGWMCTYYIYDDRNRLRAVIQPEGIKTLAANSWSLSYNSGVLLTEQCFRYEYDHRGRMIVKKVPGAGEVYMVYDARDRLVLTQDANMRTGTVKWMYTHYDDLNRPVSTGLLTNSSSRNSHQSLAANSTAYPSLSGQTYEELSNSFYDNYDWLSSYSGHGLSSSVLTTDNSELLSASNTTYPYPQAVQQSRMLRGVSTGSRIKVLGENTYLYAATFYDDKGQVIQVKSKNYSGGTDVSTTQYSFSGQPLLSILRHEKGGTNAASHVIVTKLTVDELGRVVKIEKNINSDGYKRLSIFEYDALGQLKKKKLGTDPENTDEPLERLSFDYNIRGWMLGMNRGEVLTANGTSGRRFGFELGYDKTGNTAGRNYTTSQYNGNITGMIWKSVGDGVRRKYDFTYDAANRLMQGLFEQNDAGSTWGISLVNYKVKMGDGTDVNTAYDLNGNIKRMQQWGLKLAESSQIDDLQYNYVSSTNKLKNVLDAMNDTATRLGDFRSSKAYMTALSNSKTSSATDYSYDVNGNLTQDLNKDISSIAYNFLNLPSVVTTTQGAVSFIYDAAGNKLKKVVEEGENPSKTTLYISGAIYQDDVLQFVGHEEGRIRIDSNSVHIDYFLKDHLGNVRMVLTEEQRVDAYPAATMEEELGAVESLYYSNIASTRDGLPDGYPADNYTEPNDFVAKLKPEDEKVGPGIVLRVMAGDKFNVRVSSWHQEYGQELGTDHSKIVEDLITVLSSGISSSGNKGSASAVSASSSLLNSIDEFFTSQDNGAVSTKPMAFLNWILFDEQFNMVGSSSGFDQVGGADTLKIHQFNDLPLDKNGYLYVYVSNASQEVYVYFDNLQVTHIRGPILEETHYYPFGLVMDVISSKAAGTLQNKYKYNGKEEQKEEFTDGSGLDWTDYGARMYDNQIGRWHVVDPKNHLYMNRSVFHYANNNPISNYDVNGMEFTETSEAVLGAFTTSLQKRLDKMDDDLDRLLRSIDNSSGKSGKIRNLQTRYNDLIEKRRAYAKEMGNILLEIAFLDNSSQVYDIIVDPYYSVTDALGNKEENGLTFFDNSTGIVRIIVPSTGDGLIAHELKHAFQFDVGEMSLGYGPDSKGPPLLYDAYDEAATYQRLSFFSKIPRGANTVEGLPPQYNGLPKERLNAYTHPVTYAHIAIMNMPQLLEVSKLYNQAFRVNCQTIFYPKK